MRMMTLFTSLSNAEIPASQTPLALPVSLFTGHY